MDSSQRSPGYQVATRHPRLSCLLYFTLHPPPKKEWEPQSGANERLIGIAHLIIAPLTLCLARLLVAPAVYTCMHTTGTACNCPTSSSSSRPGSTHTPTRLLVARAGCPSAVHQHPHQTAWSCGHLGGRHSEQHHSSRHQKQSSVSRSVHRACHQHAGIAGHWLATTNCSCSSFHVIMSQYEAAAALRHHTAASRTTASRTNASCTCAVFCTQPEVIADVLLRCHLQAAAHMMAA
jgi:hypothetical protein